MPRHPPPSKPRTLRSAVGGGIAEIVPDRDRPYGATLFVDGTPQSHVDLADPTYLEFEYVRHIADVLDLAFPEGRPIDALHLGGGALTLPRYLAATRPRSRQRVVELDVALTELVRRELPLDGAHRIKVSGRDARDLLEAARPASYDAVVLDVFDRSRMPPRLASRECFALASTALRADGLLIVNLTDDRPLSFAKAMVATCYDVFAEVALIAEPAVWRGRRFGNLVLVGSDSELPIVPLARRLAGGPFPASLRSGVDLVAFASSAPVVTDRDAVASPAPPPGLFGPAPTP